MNIPHLPGSRREDIRGGRAAAGGAGRGPAHLPSGGNVQRSGRGLQARTKHAPQFLFAFYMSFFCSCRIITGSSKLKEGAAVAVATAADVVVQSKKQQHAAAAEEDSGESFEDVLKGVSAQVRMKVYHLHFGFSCAFIANALQATKLENEIRRGSTPRSTSESSRPPSSSGNKQQQQPLQPQQHQLTDTTAVQQQQQRPSSAARLLYNCSTNEGLVKFRKTFSSDLEAKPAAPRPEPTAPPPPPPPPPRPAEAARPPASAPALRLGRSAPTERRRSGETRTSGSITTRMRTKTRRSKWRTKLPSLQSRSEFDFG